MKFLSLRENNRLQRFQIHLCRPAGRQPRHFRFQNDPYRGEIAALGLAEIDDVVHRFDQRPQRQIEIGDKCAAAESPLYADHPLLFERPQSLTQGAAAGLELPRQFALRRQFVGGLDLPAEDGLANLFGDGFIDTLPLYRGDLELRDASRLWHLTGSRSTDSPYTT